jgi:RNA polymerase sigma-54 factor
LKVAQKQILTPGLVQMVTVLQLNRLELKEMINQEIVNNPVLEEATEDGADEVAAEEVLAQLETDRMDEPSDQQILDSTNGVSEAVADMLAAESPGEISIEPNLPLELVVDGMEGIKPLDAAAPATEETPASTDPFDEIDFGSFFR